MATVTLRNLGGSVVMSVPRKILDLLNLDAGSKVHLSVENGHLIVQPRQKPKYTLDELLARCKPSDLKPSRMDNPWLRGGPAGSESL